MSSKSSKKAKITIPQDLIQQFVKPANFRHLVRLVHLDVRGDIPVLYALATVKGIGVSLANAILKVLNIDPNIPVGFLTDEQIAKIEEIARNPTKYGIPPWMINRPRDPQTGDNLHYLGPELMIRIKQDIELMKQIRCWKGIRHALGLKVRGQRTRTTGRKGLTVGVTRRKK